MKKLLKESYDYFNMLLIVLINYKKCRMMILIMMMSSFSAIMTAKSVRRERNKQIMICYLWHNMQQDNAIYA